MRFRHRAWWLAWRVCLCGRLRDALQILWAIHGASSERELAWGARYALLYASLRTDRWTRQRITAVVDEITAWLEQPADPS